ncbi:nucleoside 2-deoxyribosyltransferase [Pseudoneobacillus sp. C159]
MKFYIASGLLNREIVQYIAGQLKARGFTHTYDWTQNERADTLEKLKMIGEQERIGVLEADFLVVLLPGGKGTHVELGMALAHHKRIYLYSPNEDIHDLSATTTFYFLEEVIPYVGYIEDFIMMVLEKEKAFILH